MPASTTTDTRFAAGLAIVLLASAARSQTPVQTEDAVLVGSSAGAGDGYGKSVSLDGDTAVIGAYFEDTGVAYVYERSGSHWSQVDRLVPPGVTNLIRFGSDVVHEADTLLVGADADRTVAPGAGAVYVFVRGASAWSFRQKLTASDGTSGDSFGGAVDLDGDTAVVGARRDGAGSAYVFTRSGTIWTERAKLVAPDGAAGDELGHSVAVDGDRVVAGAWLDDTTHGPDAGSAYVFQGSGSTWSFEQKLRPSDGRMDDLFARSVALGGDTILCGAHNNDGPGPNSGAAFVFSRQATGWIESDKLAASQPVVAGFFGLDVTLSGDVALVCALDVDPLPYLKPGAVFVFDRDGTSWRERLILMESAPSQPYVFAYAAAVHEGTVLACSHDHTYTGAGYVFDLPPVTFCDATDGALAACPCANPGIPGTGCDNAAGTGGVRLDMTSRVFVPLNRATLAGTGFPPAGAPTVVPIRASSLDAASPVVFGDGLRCVGLPVVRLNATFALVGGTTQVVGHGAGAGTGAFYYQLWFRNTPASYCTPDAFNLSNGMSLTW